MLIANVSRFFVSKLSFRLSSTMRQKSGPKFTESPVEITRDKSLSITTFFPHVLYILYIYVCVRVCVCVCVCLYVERYGRRKEGRGKGKGGGAGS